MQYEGKIYGKIAGKYIRVDFPQDLISFRDELLKELRQRAKQCLDMQDSHFRRESHVFAFGVGSKAIAYQQVIAYIESRFPKEEHPEPDPINSADYEADQLWAAQPKEYDPTR